MRIRNTQPYGIGLLYPSAEVFLSQPVRDGLHTIQFGNEMIDILVRDRGAKTTVITFHASVRVNSTVPQLVGQSFTEAAGANLVAISDPGIRRSQDVRLGWFLGNRALGSLRQVATPLLRHAMESLRTSKTVLWGSSGGGYAAVNFGQDFPDSLVFAVNPRLNIGARPAAPIAKFMNVNFEPKGPTQYNRMLNTYVTQDLAEQYTNGLPFDLGIFQNYGDRLYREYQYEPFTAALNGDTRLWSRLDNVGEGHVHIPSETLAEIMKIFADATLSNEQSLEQAGFSRPHDRTVS